MKSLYKSTQIVGICLMLLPFISKAQQEAQHSMYFFNPVLINPGYAGSQEALVITGTLRDQWTNFKGAPKTQCLTIHSPLVKENLGLGLTVQNDQLGATKTTSAFADFAYSIRLNQRNHRLVFGLKAGMDYYRTDFSSLKINDNTDNVYTNGFNYSKTLFNVGAGIYYYGKRFYAGASTPRLIKNSLNLPSTQQAYQENHYYGFAGVVLKINSGINMRPSFIVKSVKGSPLSIDGNLSFLFYDKIWVGAMYRTSLKTPVAAGANVMFNVNQNFRIGYAYDFTLNAIQNYSAGSHEIMLSYDLRTKSKGFKSPRYF